MLRLLGTIFLGLGLAVLAADLLSASRGEGPLELRALADWWLWFDRTVLGRDTFLLVQPFIQRYLWPGLWDHALLYVMLAPAALVLLGIGALFLLLGRRRREPPPQRRSEGLRFRR